MLNYIFVDLLSAKSESYIQRRELNYLIVNQRGLLNRKLLKIKVVEKVLRVNNVKQFLLTARQADASTVTIKKSIKTRTKTTKFKLRTKKCLYTLVVKEADKAKKIAQSLPPTLKKVHIPALKKTDSKKGKKTEKAEKN
ncbi:ribosomal protein L38 [Acrasis kona]|uniref:Ribosomal protein L38 n=1 Tax=Acrasis kona TaxID=1008807 RepID=A0AAW2ZPQ5_9EUKA